LLQDRVHKTDLLEEPQRTPRAPIELSVPKQACTFDQSKVVWFWLHALRALSVLGGSAFLSPG
jgi:hypothetical protein